MPLNIIDIKGRHIPHFDGIRGIAILLVMCSHLFFVITGLGIGWVGVDLFFMISGFLITNILFLKENDKNKYRNFYMRRTLRIFPLYYLALLLIFVFPLPQIFKQINFRELNPAYFILYLQNWLFAFNDWPKISVISHFWSLAVEEQFYLLWPFIFFNFKKKRLLIIICLIILSSLIRYLYCNNFVFAYTATITRVDSLMLGVLLSFLVNNNITKCKNLFATKRLLFISTISLLIFTGIIFLNNSISHEFPIMISVGITVINIFFFCFLFLSLKDNRTGAFLRKILVNKYLIFTGKISYGLYVYHVILYFMIEKMFNYSHLISGIIAFVASYLISYLSFNLFEKRFISLKRFF